MAIKGEPTFLVADVSQLAEHPEVIEEMYEALMDSFKENPRGFASRQFESGGLTHDVQAVLVNESGGSDMGSITYGRMDEVRVVWDDACIREDDRDFVEFFVVSSTLLNIFDFTLDEIKGYLRV